MKKKLQDVNVLLNETGRLGKIHPIFCIPVGTNPDLVIILFVERIDFTQIHFMHLFIFSILDTFRIHQCPVPWRKDDTFTGISAVCIILQEYC